MEFISKRVGQIPPYVFAEFHKKKAALQQAGVDVIDLGIGDPDLLTPQPFVERLVEEVRRPENGNYPKFEGCAEFRHAVAGFYADRFGVKLDPDTEVLALIGSKEGIAHIIPTLVDPGDVVLLPDPCYPVYRMATLLANGRPYEMPLRRENGIVPDFSHIPAQVARDAKLMFLNFPGNPTSATVDLSVMETAVRFAQTFRIPIAHDAAYQMMTYDGYKAPSVLQADGSKDIAVEFGSLSKTYSMTGWRIGYAVGNKEMIEALSVYKSNTDTGQFTPIQKAAAYALQSDHSWLQHNLAIYKERRDVVVQALSALGVQVDVPKGGLFVWAPIPPGYTSASFCMTVLDRCGVIVTPGSAFGPSGEGYFRISLTVPSVRLSEAMERMKQTWRQE